MSSQRIYIVTYPGCDIDLTVIAGSEEEAIDIAMAYNDDEDEWGADAYDAWEDADPMGKPTDRRWVTFDSAEDAQWQVDDLSRMGVDTDRIRCRTICVGSFGVSPLYWEVGATDRDWVRLPAGVLCGGDQ